MTSQPRFHSGASPRFSLPPPFFFYVVPSSHFRSVLLEDLFMDILPLFFPSTPKPTRILFPFPAALRPRRSSDSHLRPPPPPPLIPFSPQISPLDIHTSLQSPALPFEGFLSQIFLVPPLSLPQQSSRMFLPFFTEPLFVTLPNNSTSSFIAFAKIAIFTSFFSPSQWPPFAHHPIEGRGTVLHFSPRLKNRLYCWGFSPFANPSYAPR